MSILSQQNKKCLQSLYNVAMTHSHHKTLWNVLFWHPNQKYLHPDISNLAWLAVFHFRGEVLEGKLSRGDFLEVSLAMAASGGTSSYLRYECDYAAPEMKGGDCSDIKSAWEKCARFSWLPWQILHYRNMKLYHDQCCECGVSPCLFSPCRSLYHWLSCCPCNGLCHDSGSSLFFS